MVLVELVVLRRNNRVHEVGWELLVRNCLPIFDIDLAKDLSAPVENDAGRLHLLEV